MVPSQGERGSEEGGETNVPYMTRMKNISSGNSVVMQEVFSVAFCFLSGV